MSYSARKPIDAVRYDASLQSVWDAFVAECKNSTFLFYRAYIDYNPRFTDFSMLFYRGKELVGLLPANISGETLASHAGLTYGGFLLGKRAVARDVMDMFAALRSYLVAHTSVTKITYRPVPHIYSTYPAEEDLYALFRYDARLTERKISSALPLCEPLPFSSLRVRKSRKGVAAGLTVCEDGNFAPFWEVLQSNLRDGHNAVPVHSLAEIELLAGRFPQNIHLFRVVDAAGRTVAGSVIYHTGQVAHVQYIGSLPCGREQGALELLFDYLIGTRFAGTRYFDFGTSVERGGRYLNEGLLFQKEGFGGRAVVYDTYEIDINSISND